jgi:glycosyltransferase involved in cell wall biosynthesis
MGERARGSDADERRKRSDGRNGAMKLLSIITPAFNASGKIAATVASVLRQEPSLIDYHVIDGGSSDDTVDLVRRIAPEVDVISEPDAGIYDAINKGIARSRGRFFYVLGAGDVLRPGIVAHLAERLATLPPNSILYGNVHWVSLQRLYDGPFTKRDLTLRSICHQALFIDRSLVDMLGPYDLRYPISADWHFNIRCFSDPRVHVQYVDEVTADYEGGGISDTGRDTRFQTDLPDLIRASFGTRYFLFLKLYRAYRRIAGIRLRGIQSRIRRIMLRSESDSTSSQ